MDQKQIPIALEAAIEAGKEILAVYDMPLPVERKEDNSPLTRADLNAHKAIERRLTRTRLPLLSEEGVPVPFETRSHWKQYWLVHPLDGTREFIRRNGKFTVNIALIENKMPVFGVIYHPVADRLYYCNEFQQPCLLARASEKFRNNKEREATVLNSGSPPQSTILSSRSHRSAGISDFIEKARASRGQVEVMSSGSSLKFCLVAQGKATVYPRFGPTMEWDTAAGHAILKAAGKNIYSCATGEELTYNKPDLRNDWFIAK